MSANVTILKPDAGHMLTDAAVYEPDGTLTAIRSKVARLPSLPAVMTARGHMEILTLLSTAFADAAAFDAWRADADRAMDEFAHWMVRRGANAGEMLFDVTVLGWSASRNRPEAYCYATAGDMAGRWIELPAFAALGPMPEPATLAGHGFPLDATPATIEVMRHGLAFMEAQRATTGIVSPGYADSESAFAVGGFVEHTVVTADAVTTTRIHDWPDRVGAKIEPRRASALAA